MNKKSFADKAKPATASKIGKKADVTAISSQSTSRRNSKQAKVIMMLRYPRGATIPAIMKATE